MKKGGVAAVLTDLLKDFNCILHQLLISKLSTYGFKLKPIAFILSHLKKQKQEKK